MELRHLRSFLALAEELHFGRAAERLGIAQPALSRQIQQLEADIGCALFERSPRQVLLTRAGEELRLRIRPHLDGIAQAVAASRAAGAGYSGRLRVGFMNSMSYLFVPQLLERLRELAPRAAFDWHEMFTDSQVDAIRAGEIDLGLVVLPVSDPGLMQRRLFQEKLVLVLAKNHPLAAKSCVSIADLRGLPFVMYPRHRRPGFHHVMLAKCAEAGFEPNVVQEIEGKPLLFELVARGVGLTLAPESSSHHPREGLVYRSLPEGFSPVDFGAVWRKENNDPLCRLFLDTAIACAVSLPPLHRQPAVA